jgi:hypothetical protein
MKALRICGTMPIILLRAEGGAFKWPMTASRQTFSTLSVLSIESCLSPMVAFVFKSGFRRSGSTITPMFPLNNPWSMNRCRKTILPSQRATRDTGSISPSEKAFTMGNYFPPKEPFSALPLRVYPMKQGSFTVQGRFLNWHISCKPVTRL